MIHVHFTYVHTYVYPQVLQYARGIQCTSVLYSVTHIMFFTETHTLENCPILKLSFLEERCLVAIPGAGLQGAGKHISSHFSRVAFEEDGNLRHRKERGGVVHCPMLSGE